MKFELTNYTGIPDELKLFIKSSSRFRLTQLYRTNIESHNLGNISVTVELYQLENAAHE